MKRNDIVFFLISSTVLVAAWIGFTIYHNLESSTISNTLSVQIQPITAQFDEKTIQQLKNRVQLPPLQTLDQSLQNTAPTPTGTTYLSPTASPSISITPTPSIAKTQNATTSGGLKE